MSELRAPFPWFGGKSRVAHIVWERFGDVPNYVEPFAGSLAVLLGRPHEPRVETVNDLDGYICNFWRAVAADPEAVAHWCDWPVNENDLHARHAWLVARKQGFTRRLEGDPDFYDAQVAGWWVWGLCCWIGSGWCGGEGPWVVEDGMLLDGREHGDAGRGVNRQRPHMGNAGMGVNRQLPHLSAGMGVNRQLPHMGNAGRVLDEFIELAQRLRGVRMCCGDWTRVVGPSPTTKLGMTGVFLDPPYSHDERAQCYAEDHDVAADVRSWALEHGDNPLLRIALCGYVGEHVMPGNWTVQRWKAKGGYGSQGKGRGAANAGRECIWFSPGCLAGQQTDLLSDLEGVA